MARTGTTPLKAEPKIAIVDDARFDQHHSVRYHPERPERLEAARAGLARSLPPERRLAIAARPVRPEEVGRVHPNRYLDALERALARGAGQLDPDTYFGPGTREAAWMAAGGAADMAMALMEDRAKRGVALLRPPGHHARPATAMGFCLLNNVAIAATAALERGAERVAIVDWDVHHGNGTQERFYGDPRVLFISLHQWPFFPGTGTANEVGSGEGRGRNVNVALPSGSGPEIFGEAFRRLVRPLLDAFDAQLTLVSAGFDAHARDPLAGMELDAGSYAAMGSALVEQAEQAGHGRVGLVLEGGYDLRALEESTAAATRALLGERTPLPEGRPKEAERRALDETIAQTRPHWSGRGAPDPFGPA
ncbi:MAG: histone deacetylase [Myxococcota bacterium]